MFLTKFRAAAIGVTTATITVVGVMSDSMGLITYFSSSSANTPNVVFTSNGKKQKIDQLYQKLSQPVLATRFNNETVTVEMTYLGLWQETRAYAMGGIKTDDELFLAHRGPNYKSSNNALGSSDSEYPPFVVMLSPSKLDQIDGLKKYQKIKVTGAVRSGSKMHKKYTSTFAEVLIEASKIQTVN